MTGPSSALGHTKSKQTMCNLCNFTFELNRKAPLSHRSPRRSTILTIYILNDFINGKCFHVNSATKTKEDESETFFYLSLLSYPIRHSAVNSNHGFICIDKMKRKVIAYERGAKKILRRNTR